MLFAHAAVWMALGVAGATVGTKRQSELPPISLPVTAVASLHETGTFLENVAMRPNGDLVVTQLQPDATLYLLKNTQTTEAELIALQTFPNANSLIGITDIGPDTFLLTAQEFQTFLEPVPNTTAMWEVKFPDQDSDQFTVRKIADLPAVGMFNGMDMIPQASSCQLGTPRVLLADSLNGQIARLDTSTGASEIMLDIPELHAGPESSLPVGVNGLKIYNGYLYWTNVATVTFYRIAIDKSGAPVEGAKVEYIMTIPGLSALDDFSFDSEGNIWGVASVQNEVFVVRRDFSTQDGYGSLQFVAGGLNSSAIPGPTSNIFGKGDNNNTLYTLTSGGIVSPINGTYSEPAKVVAVDVTGFYTE